MSIPAKIAELIERFDRNRESYLSVGYNETQLRLEFIAPFFVSLGWDVDNSLGYAELYKDVLHEESIKIGQTAKAPDYSFRIGPVRKFFVEAKRPSVDIRNSLEASYQLRRYAWSAKLPLSILTNFREFAIYDCRLGPPRPNDSAAVGRVDYFTYAELPQKWDEIESRFSKTAVLRGSFDKFSETTKGKRGTQEVDSAFLEQIETWRESLARNIANRNPGLNEREINSVVQLIIDRIVFLRICEDRGVERYGQLQATVEHSGVYRSIRTIFERADEKYNSGLFYFRQERGRHEVPDTLTPTIRIDDETLHDVIESLYYPKSPYEFSVFPVEILGQVYERFLGKTIRLTAGHHARIQEKPEARRAGGVYYTPSFIVENIVEHTVGKAIVGKAPRQVSRLRIVDPACGSGSFLLGAYDFLLKWHLGWYVADGPAKHTRTIYQGRGGEWQLTTRERKRILLNNIFGVDIDAQAVEVTKLSLMLKVLEGETEETLNRQLRLFHERALPDLAENIKCGNSLISSDYGQLLETEDAVNPFDWTKEFKAIMEGGGFDVVIGNPPYDVLEKDRGAASWPHTALHEYAPDHPVYGPALGGKLNLFRFFIVRSLQLLKANGHYGMIVPLAILADISCAGTRRHLMSSTSDLTASCFPQKDNALRRVFRDAKLSTVVLVARKGGRDSGRIAIRVYPWNTFSDPYRGSVLSLEDVSLIDPENVPIPLVDETAWSLCKKVYRHPAVMRLGEVEAFSITRGEINQTIYREFITDERQGMARLIKGVEIGRFEVRKALSQGHREWLNEQRFLRHNMARPVVQLRRIATQRITGVDERRRVVAAIIEPPAYFADSTNSIAPARPSKYALEYVLGLLNSWLFQWRFKLTSTNNNVGTNELAVMPFRAIDFSKREDVATHDGIVRLVLRITDLKLALGRAQVAHDKVTLARQVDNADEELDRAVYQLYDLTPAEVAFVESTRGQSGGPIVPEDTESDA